MSRLQARMSSGITEVVAAAGHPQGRRAGDTVSAGGARVFHSIVREARWRSPLVKWRRQVWPPSGRARRWPPSDRRRVAAAASRAGHRDEVRRRRAQTFHNLSGRIWRAGLRRETSLPRREYLQRLHISHPSTGRRPNDSQRLSSNRRATVPPRRISFLVRFLCASARLSSTLFIGEPAFAPTPIARWIGKRAMKGHGISRKEPGCAHRHHLDTHGSLDPRAYAALTDCDHIIHAGDIGGAVRSARAGNTGASHGGAWQQRLRRVRQRRGPFAPTKGVPSGHVSDGYELAGSAAPPGDPARRVIHGHTTCPS